MDEARKRWLRQIKSTMVEKMTQAGRDPHFIKEATRLLGDYILAGAPGRAAPESLAAVAEYALARISGLELSQGEVATRYGVSQGTVSRLWRHMADALELSMGDPRYTDAPTPLHRPDGPDPEAFLRALLHQKAAQAARPVTIPEPRQALLKALEVTQELWEADLRPLQIMLTDPVPFHPVLAVVLGDDQVLGHRLLPPGANHHQLVEALTDAMLAPAVGLPRLPARLRVAPAHAGALAAALKPLGVQVEGGDTDQVEAFVDAFHDSIEDRARPTADDSYLRAGVAPDEVARLFDAAHLLVEARPWEALPEGTCCRIALDLWGHGEVFCVAVGRSGHEPGLLFFNDLEQLRIFHAFGAGRTAAIDGALEVRVLGLNLGAGAALSATMRKEAMRQGWQAPNPDAFPRLLLATLDGMNLAPGVEEHRVAAACADILCALVTRESPRLRRGVAPAPTRIAPSRTFPEVEPREVSLLRINA